MSNKINPINQGNILPLMKKTKKPVVVLFLDGTIESKAFIDTVRKITNEFPATDFHAMLIPTNGIQIINNRNITKPIGFIIKKGKILDSIPLSTDTSFIERRIRNALH